MCPYRLRPLRQASMWYSRNLLAGADVGVKPKPAIFLCCSNDERLRITSRRQILHATGLVTRDISDRWRV